ncbi:MAG: hypothetical protein A2Y91_01075 [Chloroflexi bacterium RBG_13_54_8]|nr:MAG: hypothetical protein A2Y91_01075 [Chloroflexi bacterium RBG_13_54_8]
MWVIGAIAGVVLFLILLLLIPIDLVFSVEKDAHFRSKVRSVWLFGLVGKGIGGGKNRQRHEEGEKEKFKKRRGEMGEYLVAALNTEGFPHRLFGFVREVFRLLKVRKLKADFRAGLGGPVETGMLFALLGPAVALVRSFSSVADIRIEPDFEKETLEGYCEGDIRVVPIRLVKPLASFLLSRPTMRAAKAVRKCRQERKRLMAADQLWPEKRS